MFVLFLDYRDILYKVGDAEVLSLSAEVISSILREAFSIEDKFSETELLTVLEFVRYIDPHVPMDVELANVVSNTEEVSTMQISEQIH